MDSYEKLHSLYVINRKKFFFSFIFIIFFCSIKFRRQYRRYWTLGRRRDWGTGTSFTPIAQKSVQTHSFLDWCFRPLYFYPICTKFSACIITYVIRINILSPTIFPQKYSLSVLFTQFYTIAQKSVQKSPKIYGKISQIWRKSQKIWLFYWGYLAL